MILSAQALMPFFGETTFSAASDDGAMRSSYDIAGAMVRESLAQNPGDSEVLNSFQGNQLLVVKGCYDQIGKTLSSLGTPFTEIAPHELSENLLKGARFVFVNCGDSFPAKAADRLARFVEAGGFLLTTDYMLKHVLEMGFRDERGRPLYVRHDGMRTVEDVVALTQVKNDDPAVRGFFAQSTRPRWWIEDASYPIDVVDTSRVEVLARSDDLKRKRCADPVIVRFWHGEGAVVHMISHVYLQKSVPQEIGDGFTASDFATSMGASPDMIDRLRKTQFAEEMSAHSISAALFSTGFVARTLVDFATRSPGKTAVGAMMGAALTRSDAEKGLIPRDQLIWRPRSQVQRFDRRTGNWEPWPSPFVWDPRTGFYTLPLPPENTWLLIGDGTRPWGSSTLLKVNAVIQQMRQKNPNGDLIYVPIKERRTPPQVSRLHALIAPLGPTDFKVTAIDGDVSVLMNEDSAADRYCQAKRDESTFLFSGNRVRLAPEVVFGVRQ